MRIRLKAPFFFNNHRYEPGEIVDLPEGVPGPHKSRAVSPDRIDYDPANGLDANHVPGEVALEPLFDVVEDEQPAADAETGDGVKPVALLEKPDAGKSAATKANMKPANFDT